MKTVINIKTDIEVKEAAQKIAKELGIPLSIIVNAHLKEFIRERKFSAAIQPKFKPKVWKELQKATKEGLAGKNVVGPFKTSEEMNEYLDSL